MQALGVYGAFFKVTFHRFVVHFDHTFDESLVNTFNGGEIGFALVVVKAVNYVRAVFVRKVERQHFIAESFTQIEQQFG